MIRTKKSYNEFSLITDAEMGKTIELLQAI